MEALRQWGFALCCAAVVCSIAQMMAPKTSASTLFKLTLSVFFLCCICSPVLPEFNSEFYLSRDESQEKANQIAQQLTENVQADFERQASDQVEDLIAQELKKIGVIPNKITIIVNRLEDESISISRVEIQLDSQYSDRSAEIQKILDQKLGLQELQLAFSQAESTGG